MVMEFLSGVGENSADFHIQMSIQKWGFFLLSHSKLSKFFTKLQTPSMRKETRENANTERPKENPENQPQDATAVFGNGGVPSVTRGRG